MRIVYLDHNILNRMVRGSEDSIRSLYEADGLCPVYSNANLDEIADSSVRRDEFLDLLIRLEAWYLSTPMDGSFNTLDQFVVTKINPREKINELAEARAGHEENVEHLDFLSIMYGGGEGRMPSDVLLEGLEYAANTLRDLLNDPEFNGPNFVEQRNQAIATLENLPTLQEEIRSGFRELDERARSGPLTQQMAEELGIGPTQLNNVKPPNVIQKVWEMVRPSYAPTISTMDEFLTTALSFNANSPNTQPEIVTRVNGLYNLLNILGFWRDEDLNRPRRMKASFDDMTHVGYAISCNALYCGDKRMNIKAQAIYEHCGITTQILDPQS